MTDAYDAQLCRLAEDTAKDLGIPLKRGTYLGVAGPNYETPAEIRMFHALGADAVGMSTVLEVIAARHMGVRVCGLSCITNKAAGLGQSKLSHEEVIYTVHESSAKAVALLSGIINAVGDVLFG
jgi:purine-nucleoside phosphorylase